MVKKTKSAYLGTATALHEQCNLTLSMYAMFSCVPILMQWEYLLIYQGSWETPLLFYTFRLPKDL